MVALRGDLTVYTQPLHGVDLTFSAAVYVQDMYTGLFVEPSILFRTGYKSYEYLGFGDGDDIVERQRRRMAVQSVVGYHWMWDSGLNLAVAAGAALFVDAHDDAYEEYVPTGYMRFGYAF